MPRQGSFPLHEDSQPIHHEPVEAIEMPLTVADFEIVPPTSQDRVDFADHFLQAQVITTPYLRPNLFS